MQVFRDFRPFVCSLCFLMLLALPLLGTGCSSGPSGSGLTVDGALQGDLLPEATAGDSAAESSTVPPDAVGDLSPVDVPPQDDRSVDLGEGEGPAIEIREEDLAAVDLPAELTEDVGTPDVCVPECPGECGPDGCGGSCGDCLDGWECQDGKCIELATPCNSSKDCDLDEVCDKEKGICVECIVDDDCGADQMCTALGECVPAIPCESDKTCKDLGLVCNKEKGVCVECLTDPDCPDEKFCLEQTCAPDVCQQGDLKCEGGAVWGCSTNGSGLVVVQLCSPAEYCLDGACHAKVCEPSLPYCQGDVVLVCDELGSGPVGETVDCTAKDEVCINGYCVCIPDSCDSLGAVCGSFEDGCGNPLECGVCGKGLTCVAGQCVCIPDCTGKVCGSDGCDGTCGSCPAGKSCVAGECVCIPQSCTDAGVECGTAADGCGDTMDCGTCPLPGFVCFNGKCACVPNCAGKECGPNGCGGECGTCNPGFACVDGTCGVVCGDGFCIEPESRCNCPADCGTCTGCCSNQECLAGTANTACGISGAACAPCPVGTACQNQKCSFVCGDLVCSVEGGETCLTCPGDCGQCPVTPGFKMIKAGSFWMGSPAGEACPAGYTGGGCGGGGSNATQPELGRDGDETLHVATLTRNYEIMAVPVTQGQWKAAFGGWNPSAFSSCGDNCPVENMTWYSALVYANWMSAQAGLAPCYVLSNVVCGNNTSVGTNAALCMSAAYGGVYSATVGLAAGAAHPYDCKGYRLPMEAEWEYAARAGTVAPFHDGQGIDSGHSYCEVPFHLTNIAWYCGNTTNTKPVGGKNANAWELKDMSGNVWEMCWDWKGTYAPPFTDPDNSANGAEGYRVRRGGSWESYSRYCRNANRGGITPSLPSSSNGFRLARTL